MLIIFMNFMKKYNNFGQFLTNTFPKIAEFYSVH